jgi:undecaprenyl-diphosphatase
MLVIGVALLITAALLYYARKQNREGKLIEEISKKQMTFSGLLQGFSIIPGISRSGITMSGLLFMSVEKEDSIKGSFIMSIPAVLGGFVLNLIVVLIEGGNIFPLLWWQLIIAIIITAIVGYLTMELFLLVARRYNFAIVCLFLGIITLLFFFLRWIG